MATIQYVVNAQDAASATFERIAGSADHLLEKLDEIGAKTARARLELKGNDEAELKIDQLDLKMAKFAKRVADGKLGVDGGAAAILQIRKAELELDKFGAKDVTAKIHVDTSALSKLSAFQPSAIGTAVALSPALIPLAAGVATGVGAIAISFGAAGIAAGGFGLVAKSVMTNVGSDATKLATLQAQLAKDTTAKQKAATQAQITALETGWSKAYTSLVTSYQQFTGRWEKLSSAIATPALAAWFGALNKMLQFLRPALQPVADLFEHWGKAISRYFSDPITNMRIKNMAAAFGDFAAIQLGQIAKFLTDVAKAFFNLGKDLVGTGAHLGAAGTALVTIGGAFLTWSKSAKARADVQGFMDFLHKEGPVVTGILRDLGKLLPGIFAGATTVGTLELRALGNFLNLVANLPPGWQKPLTEFAGAMLLLSKIGVVKVGLKLVGLGGALPGLAGAGAAGGPMAAAGAAMAAGVALKFQEDFKTRMKDITGALGHDLAMVFSGLGGFAATGAQGLADTLVNHFSKQARQGFRDAWHAIAGSFDVFRHTMSSSFAAFRGDIAASMTSDKNTVASIWDTVWRNTVTRAARGINDVISGFTSMRQGIATRLGTIRSNAASVWNTIWSNTVARVQSGIVAVNRLIGAMPARIRGYFSGAGTWLTAAGRNVIQGLLNGLNAIWNKVKSFISGIAGWIKAHKGPLALDSKLLEPAGRALMSGLHLGLSLGAKGPLGFISGLTGTIGSLLSRGLSGIFGSSPAGSAGSGVQRWRGTVLRALAMEHLPASLVNDVLYQMQTESGGNPGIVNNWDINAQMGTPSKGLMQVIGPTFAYWHWPGTSWNILDPLANIAAALNYAAHGKGFGSGIGQIGSGHGYDSGGWLMPGVTMAVNTTGRPEQVIPNSGPGSMAEVTALLRQLVAATQATPAQTGVALGRALSTTAAAQTTRARHGVRRPLA